MELTPSPGTNQLNGWEPRYWTGGVPSATGTGVTLSVVSGKLRFTGTKRYSQAIYRFTTVPGRVYKVKYKLSNSTIPLVNISVNDPVHGDLATFDYIATFGIDRELTFTAKSTVSIFYFTKSWSVADPTASQSIDIDYVKVSEEPTGINYISCANINEVYARMVPMGVNMSDSTTAKNQLNNTFKRSYSFAYYNTILAHCSTNTTTYVMPLRGNEKDDGNGYRFAFNGKEDDDETKTQDYGMRIYNPALGKFLSVDPIADDYPELSCYQFGSLNPIQNIDIDGLEGAPATGTFILFSPEILRDVSEFLADAEEIVADAIDNFVVNIQNVGPSTSNDYEQQPVRAFANDLFYATPVGSAYTAAHPNATPEQKKAAVEAMVQPTGFKGGAQVKVVKTPTITANATKGKAFEQVATKAAEKTQREVKREITIKTQSGVKTRVDIVGKSKKTGAVKLTEAKSSAKAPLTQKQKVAYPEIAKSGGTVVGKGKAPYTGGTKIPPTKVKIVRPKQVKK